MSSQDCTIPSAINYVSFATDPTFCDLSKTGCMDSDAINYDSEALVQGTTDCGPHATVYELTSICTFLKEYTCEYPGCGDITALNYDSRVTVKIDSTCIDPVPGCTNPESKLFDPIANVDDGSCMYEGCTDSERVGYDPTATMDWVNISSPFYQPDDPTTAYNEQFLSTCFGYYNPPPPPPPKDDKYVSVKALLSPCHESLQVQPTACSATSPPDYCNSLKELVGDPPQLFLSLVDALAELFSFLWLLFSISRRLV